jgi:hypothetical protein
MKVGQKSGIVRWISERLAQRGASMAAKSTSAGIQEIDSQLLRHVAGGNGSTLSPGKTW